MIEKYETERVAFGVRPKITRVIIEKETDSSVWINGRRRAKESEYAIYHDSWADAHSYLSSIAVLKVNAAESELRRHLSALAAVKEMKPC